MKIPDDFAAKLLGDLRPRERAALGLRFMEQFSVSDSAQLLAVKPDSFSGHLTKGVRTVAKILDGKPEEARDVLATMGEWFARQRPKQSIVIEDVVIDVLPHREVMGGAVNADAHLFLHTLRYFVIGVDGRPLAVQEAEQWAGRTPVAVSSLVIRELLAMKEIKPREKYNAESRTYFWPAAFGCAELYYERDFDHRPLTLPLPEGKSIMDHFPPVPANPRRRSALVPKTWPFRVIDLGEYAKEYDIAMAEDVERALRIMSRPRR
jgi:hypothetical protein